MQKVILLLGIVCLMVTGCLSSPDYVRPRSERVDPTVAPEGVSSSGVQVSEILEVVGDMVPKMMANPIVNAAVVRGQQDVTQIPKVIIEDVKNNTRFAMNKGLFMRRFRVELNRKAQGKLLFLARENLKETMAERELRGEKGITSADYILTGTIDGLSSPTSEGGTQESFLYYFRLIDTSNDIILWEDTYVISKMSVESLINR